MFSPSYRPLKKKSPCIKHGDLFKNVSFLDCFFLKIGLQCMLVHAMGFFYLNFFLSKLYSMFKIGILYILWINSIAVYRNTEIEQSLCFYTRILKNLRV